jgi:hypothetical protein
VQPHELKPESFSQYPPQARSFAIKHLTALRQVPLPLLPVYLCEIIDYDWRFPLEQRRLIVQFDYLDTLQTAAFAALMAPFAAVSLDHKMSEIDWINRPAYFREQLSASLWSTRQIDDYHEAASQFQERLERVLLDEPPISTRFTIVTVGQGVQQENSSLFRMLRPHGALFTGIRPDDGMETLFNFVNGRAKKFPKAYAHWYIEGGRADALCDAQHGITVTSYDQLSPIVLKELKLTESFVEQSDKIATVGPEAVQSFMAALSPETLGLRASSNDAALRYFETKVITEGAGTQVFSTTFVQWAAREALRRAQPITMLARFAPRQCAAPINELLKCDFRTQQTDPEGSLIDADMGAYYTWINQGRLAGAEQARFLAWFEGHGVALAIAPTLPQGTISDTPANMKQILDWMS